MTRNALEMKNHIQVTTRRASVKEIERLLEEIIKLPDRPEGDEPSKNSSLHYLLEGLHLPTVTCHNQGSAGDTTERVSRVQAWIDRRRSDRRVGRMIWITLASAVASAVSAAGAYIAMKAS